MKTILIVDDVQTDRDLAAKVVGSLGHHAEHASSGDDALNKAKTIKPDLVLLDIVMPGTDGYAVCRKLKADPDTAKIPVILVTSKSTEADRFWGQKQGASDHVQKPYQPDTLATAIRKFV